MTPIEKRVYGLFIILMVMAGGVFVYSQTPPGPNTIQHGEGSNMPTVTADNYYLGMGAPVDVTDHLTSSLEEAPSYTLFTAGGNTYAKNGATGQIEFSGSDAVTVALQAANNGDWIHFKEGTFVFTNSLWVQSKPNLKITGSGFATILKPDTVRESTLTVQANLGTSTLTVADGTQFQVNQHIVCGTKNYVTVDKDWRRITNIVGNVLTLGSALTYTHLVGAPVWTAYRVIEASASPGIIIEDLKIDGNKANQYYYTQANAVVTGSIDKIFRVQNGIHLYQCDNAIIRNVYTDSIAGWGGIVLEDVDYFIIDACTTNNGVNHGIIAAYIPQYGSITNCKAKSNGSSTTGLGHGICVEGGYYVTVSGNTAVSNYVDGYYIWGTGGRNTVSGNTAYNNRIGINMGSVPNSAITGNVIVTFGVSATESIGIKAYNEVTITGNSVYIYNKGENLGAGILVNSGAVALTGVIVSDNAITRWSGSGYFDPRDAIYLKGAGGNAGIVSGNVITGTYARAGIIYDATATAYRNQKIDNNVMSIATTPYGISILSTGVDETSSIKDNIITGATNPVYFATAANEPRWNPQQNLGYVTENSGTETILNGTTSIIINHGLGYTPTSGNTAWTVSYLELPTNDPGSWYITTFTATQATIHVFRDPGASNLDISWSARRTP